jgi:replicative DNA helicase
MNTYLLDQAKKRTDLRAQQVKEKQPIPKPKSLQEIKEIRLVERELEKNAPLTGFPELDSLVKGFIPGHLYTVTGETNVGKSSVAVNFAVSVAKQPGRKVLYVALEPDTTVIEYVASVYHDKKFDDLTPEDLDLSHIPIDVLGKESIDSSERMVEILESYDRYDLVIIDHIGYFVTSTQNYLQQQSNAIKQLVAVAKKKRCAMMVIAHLRKRGKGEKRTYTPSSDDISGSASFKQDSTEVFIITRDIDEKDPDGLRYTDSGKLFITKSKSGPNGTVSLFFSERKAKISSPKKKQLEDPNYNSAVEIFGF